MSGHSTETNAERYVGQRVRRKEDRRLLTGQGRFVDDISLPGMLHAAFVRSPIARGAIKRIEATAARAVPGVRAVFTGADLNGLVKTTRPVYWPANLKYPDVGALPEHDVRFAGQPVVLVVAEDRYTAEDAAELVEVEYEQQDAVLDYLTAGQSAIVHPELGSNFIVGAESPHDPQLEEIFANAAHVVEETFHQQTQLAMPIETRGIVASFADRENLKVWLTAQSPHLATWYFGEAFGLGRHQVQVFAYDVGGSFGVKGGGGGRPSDTAVVAAALRLGRPVKWIEDRMEHLIASNHARQESATVKMAFDSEFRILAAHIEHLSNAGAFPLTATTGAMVTRIFPGPYRMPRVGFRHSTHYTNTCGRAPYRGPWMFETVAREAMMDVAARRMGVDPLELRRRNVFTQAEQPYTTATGIVFDRVSPDLTLEQAAQMLDLATFRAEQKVAREQGRYLGVGMAVYMEPTAGIMPAPYAILAHNFAQIRMEPTGDVVVFSNANSQGQSTETTLAQVVADGLGVDFNSVRVMQGDSAMGGFGAGAAGSRQAVIGGGAAMVAAKKLRAKILAIAAHMLEAAPEDLTIAKGTVSVNGVPDISVTIRKIAEKAYFAVSELPGDMEPGLEVQARYAPDETTWANAAHACTVEVDIESGVVKILRWIASEDCGELINPHVVEGQVSGGVMQGIGGVLYEQAPYDGLGNPLAATMKDYHLPLAMNIPVIEFGHVCTPSKALGGFKGVGEGGAIIAPPTLINAIADALAPFDVTCNRLPLSPDRIVVMLAQARRGRSSGSSETRYSRSLNLSNP